MNLRPGRFSRPAAKGNDAVRVAGLVRIGFAFSIENRTFALLFVNPIKVKRWL